MLTVAWASPSWPRVPSRVSLDASWTGGEPTVFLPQFPFWIGGEAAEPRTGGCLSGAEQPAGVGPAGILGLKNRASWLCHLFATEPLTIFAPVCSPLKWDASTLSYLQHGVVM